MHKTEQLFTTFINEMLGFNENLGTKKISARDRDIFDKRYQLSQPKPYTLESLGEIYDISRERVRQIESRIFNLIQKHLKTLSNEGNELKQRINIIHEIIANQNLIQLQPLMKSLGFKNEHACILFFEMIEYNIINLGEYRFITPFKKNSKNAKQYEKIYNFFLQDSKGYSKKQINHHLGKLIHDSSLINDFLNNYPFDIYIRQENGFLLVNEANDNPILYYTLNINLYTLQEQVQRVLWEHGSPLTRDEISEKINKQKKSDKDKFESRNIANQATDHKNVVYIHNGLYALKEWNIETIKIKDLLSNIIYDAGPEGISKQSLFNFVSTPDFLFNHGEIKENTINSYLSELSIRNKHDKYVHRDFLNDQRKHRIFHDIDTLIVNAYREHAMNTEQKIFDIEVSLNDLVYLIGDNYTNKTSSLKLSLGNSKLLQNTGLDGSEKLYQLKRNYQDLVKINLTNYIKDISIMILKKYKNLPLNELITLLETESDKDNVSLNKRTIYYVLNQDPFIKKDTNEKSPIIFLDHD